MRAKVTTHDLLGRKSLGRPAGDIRSGGNDLERAVKIDPSYEPAWEALGGRYYLDSTFGNGGEGMFQRSNRAYEKAITLDPSRENALGSLITNWVERGELRRAYNAATDLVRKFPRSADAHFTDGYVLRYAGMLEKATGECNTALALDPGNRNFRSCAWAFLESGNILRAKEFVHLDAGTEWAAWVTPYVFLAEGKVPVARESVNKIGNASAYHRDLTAACLAAQPPTNLNTIVRETELAVKKELDPEAWYHVAMMMAYCGQKEPALRLLNAAVQQNYCAYSALLSDPLLANLRGTPAFSELLSEAKECQSVLIAQN